MLKNRLRRMFAKLGEEDMYGKLAQSALLVWCVLSLHHTMHKFGTVAEYSETTVFGLISGSILLAGFVKAAWVSSSFVLRTPAAFVGSLVLVQYQYLINIVGHSERNLTQILVDLCGIAAWSVLMRKSPSMDAEQASQQADNENK